MLGFPAIEVGCIFRFLATCALFCFPCAHQQTSVALLCHDVYFVCIVQFQHDAERPFDVVRDQLAQFCNRWFFCHRGGGNNRVQPSE